MANLTVLFLLCSDLGRIDDLQKVILGTFASQSEEVRSAASYALGGGELGHHMIVTVYACR